MGIQMELRSRICVSTNITMTRVAQVSSICLEGSTPSPAVDWTRFGEAHTCWYKVSQLTKARLQGQGELPGNRDE